MRVLKQFQILFSHIESGLFQIFLVQQICESLYKTLQSCGNPHPNICAPLGLFEIICQCQHQVNGQHCLKFKTSGAVFLVLFSNFHKKTACQIHSKFQFLFPVHDSWLHGIQTDITALFTTDTMQCNMNQNHLLATSCAIDLHEI